MAGQTRWGRMRGGDEHVHFFSHHFFELLAAQKPGLTLAAMQAKLEWQFPPAEPEKLAEGWARDLDRHGVARAALSAGGTGSWYRRTLASPVRGEILFSPTMSA